MAKKVLSRLDIILFANTAQYKREMADTGRETNKIFNNMKDNAAKMAKTGAAALGAMAAAGAVAVGVLIKEQTKLAAEVQRAANIAGTNTDIMQKQAAGAKMVGVEMDKLADIYKDVQDKVGDFLTTGGGAMADFFETVAPRIGVTAEEFRKLSGPDALQLYYDSLEKANLSQSEMVFFLEAIASDASWLIPLLRDGGEGFDAWGKAAYNAGAIMDEKTIRATQELQTSTELLTLSYTGAKNQISAALMPTLSDLAAEFVGNANAQETAYAAGKVLAGGLKVLATGALATMQVFEGLSSILTTTARTMSSLFRGISPSDNVIMLGLKMAINYGEAKDALVEGDQQFQKINARYEALMASAWKAGNEGRVNPYVHQMTEARKATDGLNTSLAQTGAQYLAAQEAADKAAKSAKDAAKGGAAREMAVREAVLGGRKFPISDGGKFGGARGHNGLDLLTPTGTQVYAPESGTVKAYGSNKARGGLQMVLVADSGKKYGFAHLSSFDISDGTRVDAGMGIAKTGATGTRPNGKGYGAHLHLTVTDVNGKKIDPATAKVMTGGGLSFDATFAQAQERMNQEAARLAEMRERQLAEYGTFFDQVQYDLNREVGEIYAAGHDPETTKRLTETAKARSEERLEIFKREQEQKIAAVKEYALTEEALILKNAQAQIDRITTDRELTKEQRAEAYEAIRQRTQYEINLNQLRIDKEKQAANEWQQTREEQIRNEYALERRELMLTLGVEEEIKNARLASIDALERRALEDMAAQSRSETGARVTDYLRLSAELNGTSDYAALAETYRARMDIVEQYEKEHTDKVLEAEQMRNKIRMDFEMSATQLSLSSAEAITGNMASAFGTMLGEQSRTYKALFALQQSFVMASAGINMYKAYSDAMAEGATMTQKLTAAATVVMEFNRIITAAKAVTLDLPGYKTGGYTGDGSTDAPAGVVHGKEFVAHAEATRKHRPELEAMNNGTFTGGGTTVNVNVNVSSDGRRASAESDKQVGRNFGQAIVAAVKQQLIKEQRQGGLLYG